MAKYQIKDIQCGITACGLDADTVNVEVAFQKDSGEMVYISAVEFESFPNIFKTEESVYNKLLNHGFETEDEDDEHSIDERHEQEAEFFEDLNENKSIFGSDNYNDFYDDDECCGELREAVKFVIYIVRSDWDEIDRAKKEYTGKTIGEFEIPKCDAERAWEQGVDLGEEE